MKKYFTPVFVIAAFASLALSGCGPKDTPPPPAQIQQDAQKNVAGQAAEYQKKQSQGQGGAPAYAPQGAPIPGGAPPPGPR